MPAAILGPIAGSVVGGLMSDGGEQQTSSKEPWAAAAPWMRENLRTGQGLQSYYQQNPFNQQQQIGYQNLFGDLDSFRNQMAPGLMGFANQLMNTNYQRGGSSANSSPTGGGLMGGAQSMRQGNGMMPLNVDNRQRQQPTLLNGPFSAPQGQSYGAVDFASQNPFTNGSMAEPEKAAPQYEQDEMTKMLNEWRQRKEQEEFNSRFA